MTVTPTRCVPTLKDPTSVAVFKAMKETAEDAQANRALIVILPCVERFRVFQFYSQKRFLNELLLFRTADIDECASPEVNSCHSNALCTNTEGSYICRCLQGHSGNGKNCTGKVTKG